MVVTSFFFFSNVFMGILPQGHKTDGSFHRGLPLGHTYGFFFICCKHIDG